MKKCRIRESDLQAGFFEMGIKRFQTACEVLRLVCYPFKKVS